MVAEKLRDYIIANRTQQSDMFRCVALQRDVQVLQLKFLSVGELGEVDSNRTPGWNFEGGIAVTTKVEDGLADVK
jgi:hypothetical protein